MRIILTLLLLSFPLFGQNAAPVPAVPVESDLTGSIDVGYRWRTAVAGNFDTYRSVVNLGSGPKLLGAEFTLVDPHKLFFDSLSVRAYDWGDDPYSTFHLNARKSKLYEVNVDYRNMAYFDNLPSFADPLLSRGTILNEQSLDTHRRFIGVQLDLLPRNWLVPYLAFDRDTDSGHGVNAFVSDGNEYAVPSQIRNSTNNYRGGVRIDFHRTHLTLEQGGTTYTDNESLAVAAGTNYGNNGTPLLGQTLDLTSLSQIYGIHGSSIYSKVLFTANAASWLDVYGQFLFSQPSNNISYQQSDTGNLVNLSQLIFYTGQQYLLSAEAAMPHTSASVGAEIRPFSRVRILESLLTDRLHDNSATSSLLASSLVTNYSQQQIDVMFDLTSKLSVRSGYRYVWGDAASVTLPVAGLAGLVHGTLRRSAGLAGVTWRPSQKLSLNADAEVGSSSGTYFSTSLYDYQKLKIRARYQLTPALQIAFDANLLNNNNPSPGVHYDYLAHQESISVLWSGSKFWDFQGSYTRSNVRSNISYLDPGTLQPQRDLYRDNDHSASALIDMKIARAKFSTGGAFVVTSGSRPTSFFQPLAKVAVPLYKNISWISEWRYYGFSESFYTYESFRTHLITTGVRLTR